MDEKYKHYFDPLAPSWYATSAFKETKTYQKWFFRLMIIFQVEGEEKCKTLLYNLRDLPRRDELEEIVKEKLFSYGHSKRVMKFRKTPLPITKFTYRVISLFWIENTDEYLEIKR